MATRSCISPLTSFLCFDSQMPVAVGPYGQTQPSCFDRVKMGFMMGFAVGMAAGAMLGTFSCLRYDHHAATIQDSSTTDGRGWF